MEKFVFCPTWNLQTLWRHRLVHVRWGVGEGRVWLVGKVLRHFFHGWTLDDRILGRIRLIISHWLKNGWCRRVLSGRISIRQHQLKSPDCIAIMMIIVTKRLVLNQSHRWRLILRQWSWCLCQFGPGNFRNYVIDEVWAKSRLNCTILNQFLLKHPKRI